MPKSADLFRAPSSKSRDNLIENGNHDYLKTVVILSILCWQDSGLSLSFPGGNYIVVVDVSTHACIILSRSRSYYSGHDIR